MATKIKELKEIALFPLEKLKSVNRSVNQLGQAFNKEVWVSILILSFVVQLLHSYLFLDVPWAGTDWDHILAYSFGAAYLIGLVIGVIFKSPSRN